MIDGSNKILYVDPERNLCITNYLVVERSSEMKERLNAVS